MSTPSLAFFHLPGGWEWIVIAVIALLLFGKRLPDVARGMGKSIVEFKKGIKGMTDEMHSVRDDIDSQVDAAASEPAQLEADTPESTSIDSERQHASA